MHLLMSKSSKRKWIMAEDAALISCMIDLRNMGSHNADTGFKSGYLPELEKMLFEKLPNSGIKARPHIESRLKTLKREWAIVYDMMLNTSGFGWDSTRKMVTAEDDVWEAYVASHKEAAPFRQRSFPHFEELSMIYAKDRATGKDVQSVKDILQELDIEDLTATAEEADANHSNPNESGNANTPTSGDVSRAHQPPTDATGSASAGKKRKKSEADFSTISHDVNTMASDMKEACIMLSKSVHSDVLQEKFLELPGALRSVEGLTSAQVRMAIQKFGMHPNYILFFFVLNQNTAWKWFRISLQITEAGQLGIFLRQSFLGPC
ncbi:uncharacterized protein LOC116202076 isoform X2 [Punica granatum]|uniref:Uncharacterized protein LOC116202076 isoform X2 n=1 Tax=Punica granatum TaxID=22663 RepID=A0A6P8D7F2_PUNGR|nr:uncharacterized protein LOC116202076 isoform X2 [Punica granatum]